MFADLLNETEILETRGDLGVEVTGIATDSRTVAPGEIFVAVPGQHVDGRAFIAQAVEAGAAGIVCEPPGPSGLPVPVVLVPDANRAIAELAGAFYGHPSRNLGLVGVTGTDGKTTTTHLIAAILNAAGVRTGMISTVAMNVGNGEVRNRTSHTTPQATVIQRSMAQMRATGASVVALEVSSHALALGRVVGCSFDCAVFTNLAPEHLDFHGTIDNYRASKAILFSQLDQSSGKRWGKLGVVNRDDASATAMQAATKAACLGFGMTPEADVWAEPIRSTLHSTAFRVHAPFGVATLETRLAGRHNVYNWLGAIAAAHHFGASLDDAVRAAGEFRGVPGRLEELRCGQPFEVFVDFAHTPQALATTLDLLRSQKKGRLIVLFGQAGGRDLGNRRRMASAVAERADLAILTSDDPYDEDPQSIVDDLAATMVGHGWSENKRFWRIVERRAAIAFALNLARRDDCVLLAGRGPEEHTVIRGEKIPLVDADVAREVLGRQTAA